MQYVPGSRGHAGAVVLFTDGPPTACQQEPSIAALADAAGAALAADHGRAMTFVVNVGSDLCELHQVAVEGGTERAMLVRDGDDGAPLVDAFRRATAPLLSCAYSVPDSPEPDRVVDLDSVLFRYTPDLSDPSVAQQLPRVGGLPECSESPNGGWYFVDPGQRDLLRLCPCSCELTRFGFLEVDYGCRTVEP